MPHRHKPHDQQHTQPQAEVTAPLAQQVEAFKQKDTELKRRNYRPAFVYTDTSGLSKNQKRIVEAQYKCEKENAGAATIGTEIMINRYRTPVQVSTCGAPDRGYIRMGDNNLLYVAIQKAAQALPYTQSTLRFITDLLCGSGSELRYRYTTIVNGEPQVKSCLYEDAGVLLDERIKALREQATPPNLPQGEERVDTDSANSNQPTSLSLGEGRGEVVKSYRVATPQPKVNPFADRNYENVGTTEALLQQAIEDKREWERCMAEWQVLKDNSTDLDVLLHQWADDQSYFGLSYLRLSLEQGLPRQWGKTEKTASGTRLTERPKILGVTYLPCVCARMEEMSDDLKIEHIYYGEKFRYEGTIKDMSKDLVAYPSIMPEQRMKMMEKIVLDNQATKPAERPNVVMPLYIPQFDSPYYPIKEWWSIFSSMLYTLANTIVGDAVTARKNVSMFSYLIYLNMTWFEKYCADNQFDDNEAKEKAKTEYLRKISDFLKNKSNNGRIAALESITSADEKNILKSVEIVEVPHTSSKASLEDMELVGNAIFFSMGVHSSMVGSFAKSTSSSSGTQQRELTLLKQCQLMPQQRLYLNAWDFILRWNGFDKHAYMAIKQYDLSTLDASKTGLVERD